MKILNIGKLPKGWLGKTWACYNGANIASGDLFLFVDADVTFENAGLAKIILCYLNYRGIITVQPYHKIKKFYENFSSFFNLIMMSSMNVFTPFGFKLKPIGAFGPCLLCKKNDYFSIDGHASVKKNILEDLEIGKKFMSQNMDVFCFGGKGSISFRMYPDGIKSLVNGFVKGFSTGASSTKLLNLVLIILWISGSFFPFTMLIQGILNFDMASFAAATFYFAYAAQMLWMVRKIGNFSIFVGLLFPVFIIFFILVFFWSSIKTIFAIETQWKGRSVNN